MITVSLASDSIIIKVIPRIKYKSESAHISRRGCLTPRGAKSARRGEKMDGESFPPLCAPLRAPAGVVLLFFALEIIYRMCGRQQTSDVINRIRIQIVIRVNGVINCTPLSTAILRFLYSFIGVLWALLIHLFMGTLVLKRIGSKIIGSRDVLALLCKYYVCINSSALGKIQISSQCANYHQFTLKRLFQKNLE